LVAVVDIYIVATLNIIVDVIGVGSHMTCIIANSIVSRGWCLSIVCRRHIHAIYVIVVRTVVGIVIVSEIRIIGPSVSYVLFGLFVVITAIVIVIVIVIDKIVRGVYVASVTVGMATMANIVLHNTANGIDWIANIGYTFVATHVSICTD
jgi:hypothetical protein